MAYPVYTAADLAAFSGRPEASYPTPYTTQAIYQATFLFKLIMCLSEPPTDPDFVELMKLAILQLADAFVLVQPYQAAVAGPFQSETIGSYSYSKATFSARIQKGLPVGLNWWDLALGLLRDENCGDTFAMVETGSLGLFERDLPIDETSKFLQGPADINTMDSVFDWSTDKPFSP